MEKLLLPIVLVVSALGYGLGRWSVQKEKEDLQRNGKGYRFDMPNRKIKHLD